MKGKLQYISKDETLVKSWVVWYNDTPIGGNMSFVDSLPLSPDDIKDIEADSKIFDNIEARILAYPEVEFEIITIDNGDNGVRYAKLIKTEYPELEGTLALCEDITKKRTGKMTEEEWQEAEKQK
jgi:hypothetical protein